MLITLVTFGYKYGVPFDLDLMFDLRFLPNPHFVPELKPQTGEDARVREYVTGGAGFRGVSARLLQFLEYLLPRYRSEGKSYLTIGFGCTGGRHRSVAVALAMAERLRERGYEVNVKHRDHAGERCRSDQSGSNDSFEQRPADRCKGERSMIGLVVVCHEDMGAELVKAAEMIVGKIEAVATVSVKQDSAPEMLRDEIQAAIKKVDRKKGVMLFTDMFGGTPSNIALAFLGDAVEVVTGVNLSMLIKFANHRDEKPLAELAKLVQEAAQKSVVIASQMLKGKK